MTGLGTSDPLTTVVGSIVFWIAAISGIVAAFMMVFQIRNMVRQALALTVVLGGIAGMYAIMGADFLAVVQLVVYIGAIIVLMIFAIFMTPGQVDNPGQSSAAQRAGAGVVAVLVFAASYFAITSQRWDVRGAALDISTIGPIGGLLFTRYLLPFEIVSALLTVALVGAIVIARED
ncbi:MAG: NADH-quinone oxidoreductase subunit J [Chloroflexi bacterium]|nr:NADH-quinone oxidoreductase subunit J [Chloroflexota bacterium]